VAANATSWLRKESTPRIAHLAVLGVAFAFQLYIAPDLWLFYDDWAFIASPAADVALIPHVGHWSTAPWAIFTVVRDVFGINSFVPFAIPIMAAHLLLVHLIWRVMRRAQVLPWIATAASALLAFLGAGAENILWAFQVGFVGAMTLALTALLLVNRREFGLWHGVAFVAASVLSVTFSGTAIPLLMAAGIVGWVRRGIIRTALLLLPAVVAYAVWWARFGRAYPTPPEFRPKGLVGIAQDVPRYMISMLVDGFGKISPVPVVGVLLACAVLGFGFLTVRRATEATLPAYALLAAAVAFAALTAFSRSGLGVESAVSGRYVYFIVFAVMPMLGMVLTKIAKPERLTEAGVTALILLLAVYNAALLGADLSRRAGLSTEGRQQISAAYDLVTAHPGRYPAAAPPYVSWAPDVSVSDLEEFEREGWFEPFPYPVTARLNVETLIDISVGPAAQPASTAGCVEIRAYSLAVTLPWPDAIMITDSTTDVTVALRSGDQQGNQRTFTVAPPATAWTQFADQTLVVLGASRDVQFCPQGQE